MFRFIIDWNVYSSNMNKIKIHDDFKTYINSEMAAGLSYAPVVAVKTVERLNLPVNRVRFRQLGLFRIWLQVGKICLLVE